MNTGFLIQGYAVPEQNTGRSNAYRRIENLLNYLRYCCRHHASHALEKASKHTHDSKKKYCESQNLKAQLTLRRIQKIPVKNPAPR